MRRGFAFLSILLLLAVLIACNSNPGNRELIVCIDNAVAGKGAKTIAYDGSLTDGNTDINAYRILVSGGDMSLDTGWQMTDEFLLADVLSGTYSFTVQGAVASDDLSAVYPVAEDLYEIAVDGNPVSLELKSIIPGLCPYIELRFYLPYGFHENDIVDFTFGPVDMEYADGSVYENAFAHWNLQPLEGDVYTARADENGRLYIDARTRSEGTNTVYPPAGIYMLTLPVTFSNADGQEYKSTASSMVVGYQGLVASGSFDFSIGEELWEPVFEFDSQNNTVAIMNIEKDDTHNAFITRHDAAGDLGYWFNIIDKEHSILPLSLDEYGDSVLNTISIMTMDGESYSSEFMPSAGTLGLIPDGWLSDDGKHITHCYSGPAVNPYEGYSQGINEISDILILDIEGERPSLRKHFSDNLFTMAGSDPYDIFVDPGIDKPYFSDDGEGDGELHLPANSLITLNARRMAYVPDDSTDNVAIISASSQIGQITIETDSSRAWLPLPAPQFTVSRSGMDKAVLTLQNWQEYPEDTVFVVSTAIENNEEYAVSSSITVDVNQYEQDISVYARYDGSGPYTDQSEIVSFALSVYQLPAPTVWLSPFYSDTGHFMCIIGNIQENAVYRWKIGSEPLSVNDGNPVDSESFELWSIYDLTVYVKGFSNIHGVEPSIAVSDSQKVDPIHFTDIVYGNGKYYALEWIDNNAATPCVVYESTDAVNWKKIGKTPANISGRLMFIHDRLISPGTFGTDNYYSFDGIEWFTVNPDPQESNSDTLYFAERALDFAYVNGKWVAVGFERSRENPGEFVYNLCSYISMDFKTWTRYLILEECLEGASDSYALKFLNGRYVAYNTEDISGTGTMDEEHFLFYSTDGINWTVVERPKVFARGNTKMYEGAGYYFAYVYNSMKLYSSRDLQNWTEISTEIKEQVGHSVYYLDDIINEEGLMLLPCTYTIIYSTSYGTWKNAVIPELRINYWPLNDFTYGNGKFVGIGEDSAIWISEDGITWDWAYNYLE